MRSSIKKNPLLLLFALLQLQVAAVAAQSVTSTTAAPSLATNTSSTSSSTAVSSKSSTHHPTTTSREGPTYNGPAYGYGTPSTGGNAGNGGSDNGSMGVPKGGLIAIIVVVGLVAIIGLTSAVLFYLAKKRQWEIRNSIRRVSRRFTGKDQRQSNRHGAVRMQSPGSGKSRDLEKGISRKDGPRTTVTVGVKPQEPRPSETTKSKPAN